MGVLGDRVLVNWVFGCIFIVVYFSFNEIEDQS